MRKSVLIFVFALFISVGLGAKSYVPREGEIKFSVYQVWDGHPFSEVLSTPFTQEQYTEIGYVDLDGSAPSHPYVGLGVSMTDASCWWLSQMKPKDRKALLKDIFGKDGMNLSMIRLNCGASDYATELYNYNNVAGDVEMKHFSIARDEAYMIPIIKEIMAIRPDIFIYSAVWSEPGWMKDSGRMCGGSLLDEYLPAYAAYLAAYVKAYAEKGIKIDAISIHNEPLTDQKGGCPASLVSTSQEIALAGTLVPEAFRKAGLDTKIWILDYDYAHYDRVLEELACEEVRRNVSAVAWHPYSGKPQMQQIVLEKFPGTEMHLTERGPNLEKKDIQDNMYWSGVVFGALNYGSSSYSSWNLTLDEDGRPVTGKYPCGGLVQIDSKTLKIASEGVQAGLFRAFSPYVERGAQVLSIGRPYEDMDIIAFRNPDGSHVVCISAPYNKGRKKVQIKFGGQYMAVALPLGSWSITTIVIPAQKVSGK